ncbi:MAG: metal-sulfur cluster assembly factor [Bacteroidota bacterium]
MYPSTFETMRVITNNLERCSEALTALGKVVDPEIGLNIVDLGLVYELDFDEAARKIYLSMTLTTQFCPMGAAIIDLTKIALETKFPREVIQVELIFDPPWTHEMISETGKNFLSK